LWRRGCSKGVLPRQTAYIQQIRTWQPRLVEVYDTPKKLRETGEEFRVHQGGLVYPENHTQSPMPKVPTVAERNTAMQEQHARGRGSDSE